MCLIIAHKAGAEAMALKDLREQWQMNGHGAGYMFAHNGKLYVRKPFFKLRDLCDNYYREHEKYGEKSPFVLHLRFATHGLRDKINTHPHIVCDGKIGMVHNGILWEGNDPNISDTVHFCDTVLGHRTPEEIYSESFQIFLEKLVNTNKLVFLNNEGRMMIISEMLGTWDNNTWYSRLSGLVNDYEYCGIPYYKGRKKGFKVTYDAKGPKFVDDDDESDAWAKHWQIDKPEADAIAWNNRIDELEMREEMAEEYAETLGTDVETARQIIDIVKPKDHDDLVAVIQIDKNAEVMASDKGVFRRLSNGVWQRVDPPESDKILPDKEIGQTNIRQFCQNAKCKMYRTNHKGACYLQ